MPIYIYKDVQDWIPIEGTIWYFVFDLDKSNQIEWGPTMSSSNVSITNLDWVDCIYFDWSSTQTLSVWFRTEDIRWVMVRVKSYTWQILWRRQYNSSSDDKDRHLAIIDGPKIEYHRYEQGYYQVKPDNVLDNTTRNCIWISDDSGWAKVFLNDVWIIWTNSSSLWLWTLWDTTWIWCKRDWWSLTWPATWYMSRLAILNVGITETDFANFYDMTKWNYWIS